MSQFNNIDLDLDLTAVREETLAEGRFLSDMELKKEAHRRYAASQKNTYDLAMKLDSLQKSLAFKENLEYSTVEEKANEISMLKEQISSLITTSNPIIEPFVGQPDIPESLPETISEPSASVEEVTPQTQKQPAQQHRRSLEDITTGLLEVYRWISNQSTTNTLGMGGIGFLHGCIWAILFPRFTSFLLFFLASTLAGLAAIAYRDIDMTPRQRDSITVCGVFFTILASVMFIFWLIA